jgi:hypothetical protein
LALASLTGGDRSIGIVRLRTKTTEFYEAEGDGRDIARMCVIKMRPEYYVNNLRAKECWGDLDIIEKIL